RHVDLLMRAYPRFVANENWTLNQKVAYLDKCLKIAPQSDAPWLELAEMVKAGELQAEHKRIVRSHLSAVQTQFKDSPDFVNRLYADALAVFDPAEQVRLYQTAVATFEKAGRADLACDTRLRISDALADQKKYQTAFDGLMTTVQRFPTEGRYVPKLTAKMEDLSSKTKTGTDKLAKLYLDLLPKLAAYYQQESGSESVKKLYDQAKKFYESNALTKYATQLRAINIKKYLPPRRHHAPAPGAARGGFIAPGGWHNTAQRNFIARNESTLAQ